MLGVFRPLRPVLLAAALAAVALAAACSGDDAEPVAEGDVTEGDEEGAATTEAPLRFCDVYLDYLAEPTDELLEQIAEAADDPEVDELTRIIAEDDRTGRVLAADDDLERVARDRCQAEWVGAAQGGGDTPGAAQAFYDALVAGDPIGARNVASANAIARFEPWSPIEADPEAGTPTLLTIDDRSFTMALAPATIAECQVEAGVVIACTLVE